MPDIPLEVGLNTANFRRDLRRLDREIGRTEDATERATRTGTRGQNLQAEATRRTTRLQRLQNTAVRASAAGFTAARRAAGAFIGVLAGASGIALAVRNATNLARAIDRIQATTGLTSGEVQRLQASFRAVGVELDQSGDAILDIVERLGEGFTDLESQVAKSLEAIGIDPRTLRDIDTFEGRLRTVARALSEIEDSGDRLFRAREIFGDTAAEAVSLIGTIQGQRALGNAQSLSVIEQEEIDRLIELDALVGRISQNFQTQLARAVANSSGEIETLTDTVGDFTERAIPVLVAGLRTIFDNLRPIVQLLAVAKGAAVGSRAGGAIGGVLGGTGALLGVSLALDALREITPAAEAAQRPIRGMADAYRLMGRAADDAATRTRRNTQTVEEVTQRFRQQQLPSLASPGSLFRPGEAPAPLGEQFFDLDGARRFSEMLDDIRQNAIDLTAALAQARTEGQLTSTGAVAAIQARTTSLQRELDDLRSGRQASPQTRIARFEQDERLRLQNELTAARTRGDRVTAASLRSEIDGLGRVIAAERERIEIEGQLRSLQTEQRSTLEEYREQVRLIEQVTNVVGTGIQNIFVGIAEASERGISAMRSLRGAAIRLLGTFAQLGLNLLLRRLTSGGFPGIPGRQFGGPIVGGRAYIAGEDGPELVLPSASGNIIPISRLGGGRVTIRQTILSSDGPGVRAALRVAEPALVTSATTIASAQLLTNQSRPSPLQ